MTMNTCILGTSQIIIIVIACMKELAHKSSAVLMWATLLLMFGIPHFLICLIGQDEYEVITINKCSLFVFAFCLIYMVTRELLWRQTGIRNNKTKFSYKAIISSVYSINSKIPDEWVAFFFYFIIVFQALTLIRDVGGIQGITWANVYARSGKLSYFNFNTLFHFLYFSFGGVTCVQALRRNIKGVVVSIVFVICYSLINGGNRIDILPFIVSLIALFVFRTDRIRVKTIVVSSILGIVAIYFVYGILILRHYGNMLDAIRDLSIVEITERIINYIKIGKGELGLRKVFYFFMDNNGDFTDFGRGHTYLRMLLVYVPTRFSLGFKPSDFAISMGAATGMDVGLSTHPTLFGDCYANFLWLGIFLGIFWAVYASIIDKMIIRFKDINIKILAYVLAGCSYVIIGRGSVYNGFIEVAYGFVILFVIETLFKSVHFRMKRKKCKMSVLPSYK